MEKNEISDVGAASLAKCLQSNTCIESLDLSRNPLKWQGADAIWKGIKFNKNLIRLEYRDCDLKNTDQTQRPLTSALTYNKWIKYIDFTGVQITVDTLSVLGS